jgi:hypothetical protein
VAMADIVTAAQIYPALKGLLGLPELCTKFELRVSCDDIVTIACEYYPTLDAFGLVKLATAFAEYQIVLRQATDFYGDLIADAEAKLATEIGFDAWMSQRTDRAHAEFMARTAAL